MTVRELAEQLSLRPLVLPDPDREITGVYIGDLLSWVMGRASSGDAWITIMSNVNIVAVASLTDTACVILAEGVDVDEAIVKTAGSKGVNLLSSQSPAYEIAVGLSRSL